MRVSFLLTEITVEFHFKKEIMKQKLLYSKISKKLLYFFNFFFLKPS